MGERRVKMPNNAVLDTISAAIDALSKFATDLADQYVIDSPAVCLDRMDQTFVRVGRLKTGKTLLYSTKGGDEIPLTGAPINAKIAFMEMFDKFFETYAVHASEFWEGVDRAVLKCKNCVPVAREAVQKAEEARKR